MFDLAYCEWLKLRRSKIFPLSILGALSTPALLFVEALQTHFQHPEELFSFSDICGSGLVYMMLLSNMMIYVAVTAYLFSREYSENTLKTILPIPVSRMNFMMGKFCALLFWILLMGIVTWGGIFALSGLYHVLFGLEGFNRAVAMEWFSRFLAANFLMYATLSPFAYIAEKTKGFVAPVIVSAIVAMGSVALCNQDLGALYPWTATHLLITGMLEDTGFSPLLSISLIGLTSALGLIATLFNFQREDL